MPAEVVRQKPRGWPDVIRVGDLPMAQPLAFDDDLPKHRGDESLGKVMELCLVHAPFDSCEGHFLQKGPDLAPGFDTFSLACIAQELPGGDGERQAQTAL